MMNPKAICEEYLPVFAQEHNLDVLVEKILHKPMIIYTIVGYEKLSELCMRMFQAGFMLIGTEGSVTDGIEGPKGEIVHVNPCVVVVFRKMGKGPMPEILSEFLS